MSANNSFDLFSYFFKYNYNEVHVLILYSILNLDIPIYDGLLSFNASLLLRIATRLPPNIL